MTSLNTQKTEIPHFLPDFVVSSFILFRTDRQAGVRNDMPMFVKEVCEEVWRSHTSSHTLNKVDVCHSEWSFSEMRNPPRYEEFSKFFH